MGNSSYKTGNMKTNTHCDSHPLTWQKVLVRQFNTLRWSRSSNVLYYPPRAQRGLISGGLCDSSRGELVSAWRRHSRLLLLLIWLIDKMRDDWLRTRPGGRGLAPPAAAASETSRHRLTETLRCVDRDLKRLYLLATSSQPSTVW